MIYVKSVTVSPSNVTINIDEWYHGARATISSDYPKCACVCWHSEDTSIATVGATTGYIFGFGVGTTRVYAEATDGSGKKDYITVTVTEPVTGISIDSTSLTIGVGDFENLYATVYPLNATNKTVTWSSSNTTVAIVNDDGRVNAKKVGTTTITARTADGGFQASCTVTVLKESVKILKDGNSNKVEFCKTGKVWRCINHDMIFDQTNMYNTSLTYRANHNFFTNYVEGDLLQSDTTPKEYTDDEIKLLYAIDPYGVARYIQMFADTQGDTLEDVVEYKDRIFRLLFNREPKYFARTLQGEWYEVDSYDEINDVLSESEAYFGMHPIYDLYTLFEFLGVCTSILNMVFATNFFASTVTGVVMKRAVKIAQLVIAGMESSLRSELNNYTPGNRFEQIVEKTLPDWAKAFVNFYNSLNDLANAFNVDLNYNKQIINYCACETGYNVLFQLRNGKVHRLHEACELLN